MKNNTQIGFGILVFGLGIGFIAGNKATSALYERHLKKINKLLREMKSSIQGEIDRHELKTEIKEYRH